MVECANIFKDTKDNITIRCLNQMARELLLLQSSDWLFIITNGTMVEYAHKRIKEHTGRFNALYDMVKNNETPIDQIADKYEQMNPKANDGKYGCWFMWGLGSDYQKAGMLGDDKIHMAMVPSMTDDGNRAIFTDSWSYVLNSASKNKEAAIKFLKYMASEGGMEASYKAFDRYPARKDVAEKVVPDSDPAKEMYTRYASECNVQGRPMLPQTMEFITDMGTIYQSCMKGEISVDDFCKKAQDLVDKYK